MAQTQETIDGLLAEFRGYSAGMPPSYHVTMSWADFRKMLDRFDAAHRRERGDCAKLREALGKLRAELWNNTVIAGKRKFELYEIADAALAAPPRNCDSYDSADEMMKEYADDAFLEEWKEWRETGKCHPLMIDAFLCINWLFLTNEKGGNDGSK